MVRHCEVCAARGSTRPASGGARARLRRILVEDRVVALCDAHAERALATGVTSIADLRRLFVESSGRRSLLARRSPLDRRVFPARPEGRRRADGRRSSDRD